MLTRFSGAFRKLPAEIRNQIYEYILPIDLDAREWCRGTDIFPPLLGLGQIRGHHKASRRTSILRTCRLIYNEALPIMEVAIPRCHFTVNIHGEPEHCTLLQEYPADHYKTTLQLTRNTHIDADLAPYPSDTRGLISLREPWKHHKAIKHVKIRAKHTHTLFPVVSSSVNIARNANMFLKMLGTFMGTRMDIQTLELDCELTDAIPMSFAPSGCRSCLPLIAGWNLKKISICVRMPPMYNRKWIRDMVEETFFKKVDVSRRKKKR